MKFEGTPGDPRSFYFTESVSYGDDNDGTISLTGGPNAGSTFTLDSSTGEADGPHYKFITRHSRWKWWLGDGDEIDITLTIKLYTSPGNELILTKEITAYTTTI